MYGSTARAGNQPHYFGINIIIKKTAPLWGAVFQTVEKPMLPRKDNRAAGELEGAKTSLEIRL